MEQRLLEKLLEEIPHGEKHRYDEYIWFICSTFSVCIDGPRYRRRWLGKERPGRLQAASKSTLRNSKNLAWIQVHNVIHGID